MTTTRAGTGNTRDARQMPHVKKEIYNFVAAELEARLKRTQRQLLENRAAIKRLAHDQHALKRELSESWRIVMEFRSKAEKSAKDPFAKFR